jgi:hypothetical protein
MSQTLPFAGFPAVYEKLLKLRNQSVAKQTSAHKGNAEERNSRRCAVG